MITVIFRASSEGLIEKMSITGHSGYADRGEDIVCASASTLLYTAIESLEDLCGLEGFYELRDGDKKASVPEAWISIPRRELEKGLDSPVQTIMASTRKGFLLLEEADRSDYGGDHIRVIQQQG
ncbi:MAG: ribosomal-processing cysteine protease Prp [Clostridiales bacterium]|nr:ribosomal-processing cysteine protease Prp [Clostridiales bacterium]